LVFLNVNGESSPNFSAPQKAKRTFVKIAIGIPCGTHWFAGGAFMHCPNARAFTYPSNMMIKMTGSRVLETFVMGVYESLRKRHGYLLKR
jgi:hypothetical protein